MLRALQKLGDDTKRRFPNFRRPNYDGIPDFNQSGTGMIGLQEMLMQCFVDKILLLPAWPKGIDVDFKLHAPKRTTVEVSLKNGKRVKLEVQPPFRKKDILNMLVH